MVMHPQGHPVLVWDLPIRLFHWSLAVCVIGAIVTVKLGGSWMVWHERFGLTILGLLVFRLAWGVIGSTHARFARFFPTPGRLLAWFRGDWTRAGHTPLAALSVLAILLVLSFQAVTGLFADDDIAFTGPLRQAVASATSSRLTGLHMQMEWVIYALIALHIAAVLFYSLVLKKPLIRPMITGKSPLADDSERARGGGVIALVVAVAITAAAVWVASGGLLPPPPEPTPDLGW
jgi:cytochrome b